MTTKAPSVTKQPIREDESRRKKVIRSIFRSRSTLVGGGIFLCVAIISIFPSFFAPRDPININPAAALQAPSFSYPFGTDIFGRDVLSRIIYGGGRSLQLGLVAVGIAVFLGGSMGLLAGFYRGRVDQVIMRFVDVLLAFPSLLLALLVVYVLGPGTFNLMIAVGLSAAPEYARVVRGSTLSAREVSYVEAAKALGASDWTVLLKHITPNILGPVIVLATLGLASAILVASALSFLGFGASPPSPEWGVMLNEGRQQLTRAWWLSTFPGIAIMITVLGCNLFGDGLRDILDPKERMQA